VGPEARSSKSRGRKRPNTSKGTKGKRRSRKRESVLIPSQAVGQESRGTKISFTIYFSLPEMLLRKHFNSIPEMPLEISRNAENIPNDRVYFQKCFCSLPETPLETVPND
jgi:hypothetical protein